MERAPADAELFGGAAAVAAAFVQGAFDEDAFVFLEVAGRRGEDVARDAGRGGFADVHGDVFETDLAGAAEDDHVFHAIAELADVAGPAGGAERGHRGFGDGHVLLAVLGCELGKESAHEDRDVGGAFAQGRDQDLHDVEAVV